MSLSKLSLLAVASTLALSSLAAHADTLHLGDGGEGMKFKFEGQTFNNTGGGNYSGSFITTTGNNVINFSSVYCVDIFDSIQDNHNYSGTTFDTTGVVNNSSVDNAWEIAYMILHTTATTDDQEAGLQAAIWEAEYGSDFTLLTTGAIATDQGNDLAELNGLNLTTAQKNALVAELDWITPPYTTSGHGKDTSNNYLQGLVGLDPSAITTPTPEPGTLSLLGTGLLGVAGMIRRRLKA